MTKFDDAYGPPGRRSGDDGRKQGRRQSRGAIKAFVAKQIQDA